MIIKELIINTAHLVEQKKFYSETMGLKLIDSDENSFVVEIGNSQLKFVSNESFTPYHFAINIPCNMVYEALAWLKEKVVILKDGENEVQEFVNWNAESIYFYDGDRNIVELIARKNLDNESNGDFGLEHWLEVSEIGMPVDNIAEILNRLRSKVGTDVYDGSVERFCAIGDEKGLIICIDKNKKKEWYPTKDFPYSSFFKLILDEKDKSFELEFNSGEIKIIHIA
ncbi:VOC family protein [Aureibacter tunicatorum]|uniref:Catechol-2,3-dioxygenase n=1 Tax=Aureibacter tunicatorum TaxID=866807 RepID=A0AAE4BU14_9BACT|nr:hypothetical protein [Aureibacter tunicatorum]MDR6240328.1 catechol-2,3-dioxygenase [Aureibacter tunicatorum]BDD05791.1 hypothetical protein AUTU_32740 [Aureibacter tunicatorum]